MKPLALTLLFGASLALSACQSVRALASRPPSATATAGGTSISQDGAAATPAKASETTTQTAATIPPGVRVTASPDGSLSWVTAAPLSVVTTRTESAATGPAAFTPPAPPTPTEEANGRAAFLMRLGLVAGLAAGAFGLLRGWDVLGWGGVAIAAGCFLGLALQAVPGWLLVIFGGGAAACVLGPLVWHWKLKPRPPLTPAPV